MIEEKNTTALPAVSSIREMWRWIQTGWWTPSSTDSSGWIDVWSRTVPRYRRRAIILLVLNGLLFFGLGSFASWLRSGKTVPFLIPEYWERLQRSLNPIGKHQATLLDFLLDPISIEQAPMQIIVLGLLLASLVSIPILVSMLYRLPCSLPFIGIVGFVAMLPWLAITLLLSCLLTSLRPLQFKFRFATALIALIPVVIYFLSATRNPVAEASYLPPIVSTLYYTPWILAILASCLVMAIVLLIARIVHYRPGAISPLLAVSFAIPVALFEARVGRDELYYRLLENNFGTHSQKFFRDEDASTVIRHLAEQKQTEYEQEGRKRDLASIEAEIRFMWQFQLDPLGASDNTNNLFQFQQAEAVRNCDWFRRTYPYSRYIANVLYLKGRALDMRIDIEAFRRDKVLTYYQTFPSQNSAKTWEAICEQYPDSPVTAVALYRLAHLEARTGDINAAIDRLYTLEERFASLAIPATKPAPETLWDRLEKPPPTSSLDLHTADVVHSARKLRVMLTANRDPHLAIPPDIQSDAPLVMFLRCDPRHRFYQQNLRMLLTKFPLSHLQTRLRLEEILTERSSSLKIQALQDFLEKHQGSTDQDAVPEAAFRLGEAYLRDNRPRDAAEVFRKLCSDYADSPWVEDAKLQLGQLAPVETG